MATGRLTELGYYCLACYLNLPSCSVDGCGKPTHRRRREMLGLCRDHLCNVEIEKEYLKQVDQNLLSLKSALSESDFASY